MKTEHYELLYIIPLKYAGDLLQPIIDDVIKKIKEFGGEITKEDNLGRLKFAYPIKGNNQGFYILLEFDLKQNKLEKLHRWFELKQEVLRYLIIKKNFLEDTATSKAPLMEDDKTEVLIKPDESVPEESPVKESEKPEEKVPEQSEKEQILETKPEEEASSKQEEKVEEVKEEKPAVKEESEISEKEDKKDDTDDKDEDKPEPPKKDDKKMTKKKKLSLDELDKKLDEILDTDNIL